MPLYGHCCFTVCKHPDQLFKLDGDDKDGFTTKDNVDERTGEGPSTGREDNDVPVFGNETQTIPTSPDNTPLTVTIETPGSTGDSPMEVDPRNSKNVENITIIADGQEVGTVSIFLFNASFEAASIVLSGVQPEVKIASPKQY